MNNTTISLCFSAIFPRQPTLETASPAQWWRYSFSGDSKQGLDFFC